MNKEKLELFYKDEVAIHVETQKEYDDFMEYLESDTNLIWQASGKPTRVNNWSTNKEGTLLYCEERKMSYGSVFYNATNDVRNYPVLKYKELLCKKPHANPMNIKYVIQQGSETLVEFEDGDVVKVNKHWDSENSLYTAVSAALAKKVYGSNSQLKNQIKKAHVKTPKWKIGMPTNYGYILEAIIIDDEFYYVLKDGDAIKIKEENTVIPF